MIEFNSTQNLMVSSGTCQTHPQAPSLPLEKGEAQTLSEHVQGNRFMLPSTGE